MAYLSDRAFLSYGMGILLLFSPRQWHPPFILGCWLGLWTEGCLPKWVVRRWLRYFINDSNLFQGYVMRNDGSSAWWAQRITALILIPLSLWLVMGILCHTQEGYHTTLRWAAQPWNSAALALSFGSLFYHSSLGLTVIIEDYIPHPNWKTWAILKIKIIHLALAVLSWFFILRIMITGTSS
jgi:succinate dehydrogenase / fumarate reductase, membrane anchor subunit